MFSFRTTALEDQLDKALAEGRVGCFCTQNCWDTARGRYMYDLFKERGNLARLFMPKDAELTPGTNHIFFERAELEGLDAVVVEIQDAGSRYFNYTKDVLSLMEALRDMGDEAPALYVVDHLNPAGRIVEGSMPSGPVEPHTPKVAHRHGLTLGELCNLYYSEIGASFALHVVSALANDSSRQLLPWTIAPASDISGDVHQRDAGNQKGLAHARASPISWKGRNQRRRNIRTSPASILYCSGCFPTGT
jgi:hypothetical protein